MTLATNSGKPAKHPGVCAVFFWNRELNRLVRYRCLLLPAKSVKMVEVFKFEYIKLGDDEPTVQEKPDGTAKACFRVSALCVCVCVCVCVRAF